MATKKDLVEAYSFSRRRLVTAFLSGAPGGREVEPSRPGRTIVGGLALAVLLIAGAAIASVLASRTEEDWNKIGLVVSRQEAAPYVILDDGDDPTLIPVINITSAQLILGAGIEPTYVDQDVIEDQTPGDPIGIAGAPQTLPRPKQFIESGWTACTDTGVGITTSVSADRLVSTGLDLGTVVSADGRYWVLATSGESAEDGDHRRTYRYPLPVPKKPDNDPADDLLLAVGLQDVRSEATEVPLDWLNLFPEGGELGAASFDFADGGQLLKDPDYPVDARVGDYIDDGEGPPLVLTKEGPSALNDFAFAVLKNTLFGKRQQKPRPVEMERPATVAAERSYTAALWPDDLVEQVTGVPCARLVAEAGNVPRVQVAEDPRGQAVPEADLRPDEKRVVIDPGRGAFVRIGDWDDDTGGQPYVIDPRGKTYLLQGPDTLGKLDYDADEASVITDAWLKLFPNGVALSTSAALCPPALPGEDSPTPESCHEPPS
jgi:type VII secretion protein EccB